MVRRAMAMIVLTLAFGGCGEPVRGVGDDAKAAKAQANEAVKAAEDAATRVDELSRMPIEQAPPAGESERHE